MARRYRDTVQPAGVRTNLTDSGAVDFQSQLANATRQVTTAAMSVAVPLAEAKGLREGQKAGTDGSAGPIRGMAAGSPYGRAYNNAYEATYVARLQGDLKAKASEIERQYGDKPAEFHQAFVAATKAALDNTPEEYRQTVKLITQGQYQDIASRVALRHKAVEGDKWRAAFAESLPAIVEQGVTTAMLPGEGVGPAALAATWGDIVARLEAGYEEGHIDAEEVVRWKAEAHKLWDAAFSEATLQPHITRLTATMGVDVPRGMRDLAALRDDPSLTDEQKADITDEVLKFRNDDRVVKAGLYQEQATRVAMSLASGDGSTALERDIEWLNRKGAFTDDEYESKKASIARNRKEAAEKAASAATAQQVLAPGVFNIADNKHRAYADEQFVRDYGVYPPMSQPWQDGAMAYVGRFGYLPKPAADFLTNMAAPQAPAEQQMRAALFYSDVKEKAPGTWPFNSTPQIDSRYEQLLKLKQGNIDPEKAVEIVNARTINLNPAIREARAKELRDQPLMKNPRQLRETIRTRLDSLDAYETGLFGDVPADLPDELVNGVLTQIEAHWELDPSATFNEVVQRAVDGTVRNTHWGVTQINGRAELVKRPPEYAFITPGDRDGADVDALRDIARFDLESFVKAVDPEVDPTTVELVAVPNVTDRPADFRSASAVAWGVRYTNEYGEPVMLRKADNSPAFYVTPKPDEARAVAVEYARSKQKQADETPPPGRAPVPRR